MLCNISLNTPIACSIVCFPGMTSSLAKVNKSLGAHFLALFLKFLNFLMCLNIQIDFLILKTYYEQFTLTTKKSLHIIFKSSRVQFLKVLVLVLRPKTRCQDFGLKTGCQDFRFGLKAKVLAQDQDQELIQWQAYQKHTCTAILKSILLDTV